MDLLSSYSSISPQSEKIQILNYRLLDFVIESIILFIIFCVVNSLNDSTVILSNGSVPENRTKHHVPSSHSNLYPSNLLVLINLPSYMVLGLISLKISVTIFLEPF